MLIKVGNINSVFITLNLYRFGKEGFYSFEHVRQMRDALQVANILQPVTFPIRAGLSTSVESQKNILWLLNQVIDR